jgi:hypothetical protein
LNIYCIIQGPLITYGQGPNNIKKGYNASEAILANIETLNSNSIKYLYITWHPKNIYEESELNILKEKKVNYKIIKEPTILDPDHRYKHHYSINSAFSFFDFENYDHILKIRSDQIIPSEIIEYILYSNSEKFLVSELMNNNSFYIGDFIYYAETKIFREFIDSQLNRKFFLHPVIANDIGLRYYINKTKSFYLFTFFNYLFRPKKSIHNWMLFSRNHFETLRIKDWENIIWRGSKISNIISSNPFYFVDTEHSNDNINNIKIVISGFLTYIKKYAKIIFFQQ